MQEQTYDPTVDRERIVASYGHVKRLIQALINYCGKPKPASELETVKLLAEDAMLAFQTAKGLEKELKAEIFIPDPQATPPG